jgi:hypothetical protein
MAQTNNSFPPGWEFTETPNAHGMIVFLEALPSINDYLLQPGDFIGAFYTDDYGNFKCAGADYWLGDQNIIFPIFGDDQQTPEKDGFGFAEVMHFKVFSQFTQKDYNVDEISWDNSYSSTNKWYPMGLSAMTSLSCSVDFDVFISTNNNPACIGQTVQLTATIFAGAPGNISYSWWSSPEGFNFDQQTVSVIPDGTTIFFLSASDGINTSEHQIELVVNNLPEVQCGDDITICAEDCAQLFAEVENYSEILWATDGDGSFCDPTIVNPNYTPGPEDIQNGAVTVTISVIPLNPCDIEDADQQHISILPLPTIDIDEELTFCETQEISLAAGAENYSQIFWTSQGDGSFENPEADETVYFPGPSDLSTRTININVCATALEPLTYELCRQITVLLQQKPVVNSPSSRMVCSNDALFVNSVAARHSSVLWTTDGDGTFQNPEINNTYYYPGSQDKINGDIVLTVYAFGQAACQTFPASSATSVTVLSSPEIVMEEEATITGDESYLVYAQISGGINVEWSTTGDGTFAIYAPGFVEYFPGDDDRQTGQTEVTASMEAVYPCITGASASLLLNIHKIHQIDFPAGWTGFSTYISSELSMQEFFAPIMDDLVIVQSQSGVFWPQGGLNTMSGFSYAEGYKIKMNNPASFTIYGPPAINTTLQLPAGWNLIPVLSCGSIEVQSIIDQLGDELIVIKDVVGNGVVWPAMGIQTLYTLQPGNAYLLAVANSATLDYNLCSAYKSSNHDSTSDFSNNTPWQTPEKTTISHIVAFSQNALSMLQPGDVIAAFNNSGTCTGMTQYAQKDKSFALVINGDEAITATIEGMKEGETNRFKVFRASQQIFDLEVVESELSKNPLILFTENGLSVVESIRFKNALADIATADQFDIFPNPTTGQFQVSYSGTPEWISISDLSGKIIIEQLANENAVFDMSDFPRGFYFVKITHYLGQQTKKLILN